MMNSYFIEFLIKEQEQQALDEIRRNQISCAKNNLKGSFYKRSITGLSWVLTSIRNIQKGYHPLLNRH